MEENKKIVYSALKPTGDLQLGNYIGALRTVSYTHLTLPTIA